MSLILSDFTVVRVFYECVLIEAGPFMVYRHTHDIDGKNIFPFLIWDSRQA